MDVLTLTSILHHLLPEPHAGLLSGMLFGTRENLSPAFLDSLITTGTLHIIALSGFNITIIISVVTTTLSHFISRWISTLISIIFIIGFIMFVGPSPSIVRAGIMGVIGLVAVVFGRQQWSLYSLILAVSSMILLNTSWLTNLSFQLSVAATLGIILYGGRRNVVVQQQLPEHTKPDDNVYTCMSTSPDSNEEENKRRILNRITMLPWWNTLSRFVWGFIEEDLRITLSAQVFTIPLILWYFHRVSLISPFANVAIGFVIAPITIMGFAVMTLALIWLPLGQIAALIVWVPLQYMVMVITFLGSIPFASIGY